MRWQSWFFSPPAIGFSLQHPRAGKIGVFSDEQMGVNPPRSPAFMINGKSEINV